MHKLGLGPKAGMGWHGPVPNVATQNIPGLGHCVIPGHHELPHDPVDPDFFDEWRRRTDPNHQYNDGKLFGHKAQQASLLRSTREAGR